MYLIFITTDYLKLNYRQNICNTCIAFRYFKRQKFSYFSWFCNVINEKNINCKIHCRQVLDEHVMLLRPDMCCKKLLYLNMLIPPDKSRETIWLNSIQFFNESLIILLCQSSFFSNISILFLVYSLSLNNCYFTHIHF